MASNGCPFATLIIFFFFFLLLLGFSSASNGVLLELSNGPTDRRLLQTKTSCPIDFEHQNYTIITSQCKGPDYNSTSCCNAYKQFSCPFTTELNDPSNSCSDSMFSYINLRGGYYPGLFGTLCQGSKDGISCPALPPKSDNYSSNAAHVGRRFSPPLIVFSFTLGVLCL
ncbi:GPI-anchored protein LORELEI [Acorus gramineus]|uniref:GPI-anchored protein LORELEI n=1 Tax=Acorus gramineus TaxID=55184 RepID=A0AAV9BB65_ACOGR|nr:GPI-anchored protein LORELEI [Acorus gramineus]